jgi:hypothetical protein
MLHRQLADADDSACYSCIDGARDDHGVLGLVEARHTPSGGPPAPCGGFARGGRRRAGTARTSAATSFPTSLSPSLYRERPVAASRPRSRGPLTPAK